MKTFRCFLLTVIAILIFPVLNAQDITGDWYGIFSSNETDSLRLNLHIYKDNYRLKATLDCPEQYAFGTPIDEITLKKDTIFFRCLDLDITYKGCVNEDYSIINGQMIQYGYKYLFDFSRKKLIRIVPVNNNTLTVLPAKVTVIKTRNPKKILYSGIRVVKAGIPKVIAIDTSELKVLTPGIDTIPNPRVYILPEPTTKTTLQQQASGEYTIQNGNKIFAPVILNVKQSEPIPALPMRMKDAACFNIQFLDNEQGLITPGIYSILEDTRGNIWFGSNIRGICKYDGKSLTYYTTGEDLMDNVTAIIEDRNGNIWIGTGSTLCKYDGRSFTQYPVQFFGTIWSILESRNGNIWVGTQYAGVFEKKGNIWTQYTENEGLTNNFVHSINEDRYGNLWFGTERGACKYDGVSFTHFTENEGLIFNRVKSVIEDKYGNLWFGTDLGVSKYDGKSFRQFTANEGLSLNVNSIIEDDSSNLWFGTWTGVAMYDGNTFTHYSTEEGLSNNAVLSVIEDKSRNIWLTTLGGGIMKLQKNSFTYFTQLEDYGKKFKLTSIIQDHDANIWFGIGGAGLIKYDGKSLMVMIENEGLGDNHIRSILEDKDGNIWFTTTDLALQKYDGKSVTIYDNKKIWNSFYGECIYEDKKGNIWVGTWGEGLKKFDGESFIDFLGIINYPYEWISSILQDNNEDIWYGTIWGLFKYDGECITKYNINEGLSDVWITSLFEDRIGNLWIGTRKGGVNKFDGQSFTYFTEKEGLSNNNVSSIIEDKKGNIWVGTERGLSLLSPRGDGNYSIISFGTDNGLKELYFNEKSVCLDSLNRLWWGTGDIVTMLDLNTYKINMKPPVIQLNNIHLNQKYIDFRALLPGIKETGQSPSDTSTRMNMRGLKFSDVAPFCNYPVDLVLPHYLNNVTFNFSAIDWTASQSIRYQYMVEGMDEEWSPLSTENMADYRNMSSGRYKFKVKAISSANIWSETFEYPFIVRPPWWLRWWAYTFYAMVLILLARYYIRYRVGRERIKAEIKIKQFEVDKMQELDQMKSRFFANISHEFRTPLTLIIGPIEDLFKRKPERAELTWDIMGIMHRNAKRLQKLINQMLDISKLETGEVKLQVSEGNLEEFVRTIILSFLSLAESKHIRYEYNLPETYLRCYFDSDKLEKILTNLISNAFKFTLSEGNINILLQYVTSEDEVPQYVEIKVSDTGKGVPPEKLDKIFDRFYQVSDSDTREEEGTGIGLALTRELVDLYRGEISVESEVDKGSIFTVKLPVLKELFKEEEIIKIAPAEDVRKEVIEPGIDIVEPVEAEIKEGYIKEAAKGAPVVLIVEDNIDLSNYISRNLGNSYHILVAENGKAGLNSAIKNIPDLIISDVMMPEMDGMEMCHQLKTDERTNHIPVIMLTAKADMGSKIEGLETGADDYIIKPFDAEELRVRVKNLIEQRKKLRERYRKEFLTDPAGHEIPAPEDEFLVRVLDCTKKHLKESEFNVEQLGKELHLSRTQLYRKVLALTDYTPNEFIRNIRLKMAARMFLEGHRNVSSVLYTVGFNTPSYFTQSFRELFGINPSDYIKQKAKSTK